MKKKKYNSNKIHRAIHREAFIEMGLYNAFKEKSIESKTVYKRKKKHKNKE